MLRSSKTSAVIVILLAAVIAIAPAAQAASWTSLSLDDHISSVYYEGNFRCVSYDFGTTPVVSYRNQSTGYTSTSNTGSIRFAVQNDGEGYSLYAFPLGKVRSVGPPLSSGASGGIAIDVRDYKSNASVSFSSTISLNLDFFYDSYDQYLSETIHVFLEWSYAGYNDSGNYVGTHTSASTFSNLILQDTSETFHYDLPTTMTMFLDTFPENVSYIVPSCNVSFTVTSNNADIVISNIGFSCQEFSLRSRTDMLLNQSETLKAVEKQLVDIGDKVDQTNDRLDDTNEKLDEIIDHPQKEKEEATQEGNKFVDQLTGAIPSDNQGF